MLTGKQYNAMLATSAPGSQWYGEGWAAATVVDRWSLSGVMVSVGVLAAAIGPATNATGASGPSPSAGANGPSPTATLCVHAS
jgi:hypothetical protein